MVEERVYAGVLREKRQEVGPRHGERARRLDDARLDSGWDVTEDRARAERVPRRVARDVRALSRDDVNRAG